jgi:cytoskeletal protein CcmA (bactofilin family)
LLPIKKDGWFPAIFFLQGGREGHGPTGCVIASSVRPASINRTCPAIRQDILPCGYSFKHVTFEEEITMSNGATQSVITSEVEIKGTIKSSGSVRMDGKLDGDLISQGDSILGKTATMKGNISGNNVVIEGTINGSITAKDKIEMKATARITGDIKAKRLAVEDGVTFVGKADVNPGGSSVATSTSADESMKSSFNMPRIPSLNVT